MNQKVKGRSQKALISIFQSLNLSPQRLVLRLVTQFTVSPKAKQLKANPKAALYGVVMENFGEFRLFGEAELLTDSASRRRAWRDDFAMHWPDGPDSPDTVAIRFKAKRGQWATIGKIGSFTV